VLVNLFNNSTIPVFFSEYGCNKVQPRVFNEVQALYGSQMTSLSGGLIYEYSVEEEDFGLVQINGNSTVTLKTDYDNLQGQYNKLDINLIQSTNGSATKLTPPKCSKNLITDSGFSKDFDIPSPPDGADDLINNGIQNPVQGKIVQVKETNVPMAVYGSNGVQIQNLAIRPLANDESNTPNGETTSPSGTGTAPTPSASKKGSASTVSVNSGCGALLFTILTLVLTFL
jgi:1,3-beta-glucanosyltransferase GAS3